MRRGLAQMYCIPSMMEFHVPLAAGLSLLLPLGSHKAMAPAGSTSNVATRKVTLMLDHLIR